MKREHYGNFSVADMAISSRKAAKGNLLCSPSSARPGAGAREPNLAARTSCIGIGRWHPLAFGVHLSAETLVSLRFRLIGLVCVVLLISLALAAMTAYSNASRSVRTEMRAAFLVGRQTIESAIDRLQNARDPLRDLDDLVASFQGNRHLRVRHAGETPAFAAPSIEKSKFGRPPAWFVALIGVSPEAAQIPIARRRPRLRHVSDSARPRRTCPHSLGPGRREPCDTRR